MLDHVAEFIRIGADPTIFVPARLEDQYIPFSHFNDTLNHLGRIDARIADQVGNIGNDARTDPIFQRNLANRPAGRPEMLLAVHMGGQVNAGVADGSIPAQPKILAPNALGICHGQGHIIGPLRRLDAKRDGEVQHIG